MRLIAVLLWSVVALAAPADAISKTAVRQLGAAATSRYQPDGGMPWYTVLVIKGKAFASTRGEVRGMPWIALWEYNGGQWQFVYEHPAAPENPAEVTVWYRNYGFSTWQIQRLQKNWKKF